MSISQKLEKCYKNQIENIKNEKNYEFKIKQIGALVLDVGGRCISTISTAIGCCRAFVKKCYIKVRDKLEIKSNKNRCGRKKITEKYPELKNDIRKIIEEKLYTDPHFQTEHLFCSLTVDEIMRKLLNLGKYQPKFMGRSSLANLLNKMGYNLKKVKRNKPLKKIKETDAIFENVKLKKEEALNNENTSIISIDTKDKVMIGPYSRNGKSRILVEASDHELTNDCLTPFGILDLKTNQSYFYNLINDYLPLIKEKAVTVVLDDDEYNKYLYKPKLLAYDVYKNTELYYVILLLNNVCSIKEFDNISTRED